MHKQVVFRLSEETIKALEKIQKDMDLVSRTEALNIIIRNYYSNKELKQDVLEIKKMLGSE